MLIVDWRRRKLVNEKQHPPLLVLGVLIGANVARNVGIIYLVYMIDRSSVTLLKLGS